MERGEVCFLCCHCKAAFTLSSITIMILKCIVDDIVFFIVAPITNVLVFEVFCKRKKRKKTKI